MRTLRWRAPALLGVALLGCGGSTPNPSAARMVAIPNPVKLLILSPKTEAGSGPPPCCWKFVADFHLHVTANGLKDVQRIGLRVTRKADGAVYTQTLEGPDASYGATRWVAGDRHKWEIPVHLLAVFDVPNEGREFDLRVDAKLLTKTGDADLVLEPKLIEG